jgi:signal transduction histidine kinase
MSDEIRADEIKARLEQAEAALQKCSQFAVASQYAAAMMHEIHNPLSAIANLVYLIKVNATEPANVLEYADVIEKQVKVLSGIAGQVLSFHREQTLAKELDLVDLVDSSLKLHQSRISAANVAVTRNFRSPATASIFGAEILQVISNLLLNALDALPEHEAQLHIRIRATADYVHITVADNGAGIHPDVLKRLFEPYQTTKADGTGLGLWMSKRIIDKHKGKLAVRSSQSKPRSGTTFRLSLPTKTAA